MGSHKAQPEEPLPPLKMGRRPTEDVTEIPSVFYAGEWRSPGGVESVKQRMRLRYRMRRVEGTGR